MSENMMIFEIGTEEIPAFALVAATAQLKELASAAFEEARVDHGEIETMSTPRRLVLCVHDLADESNPLMTRSKGPSVSIAFDADGNPTKAAMGFARGKGCEVKDLTRGVEDGKEYVYAIVEQRARRTEELLPDILTGFIGALTWPRTMRWGDRPERFSRPVRWLFAMWNDKVIPVSFAGLTSDNQTRGHRLLANEEYEISDASRYLETLARAWVIPSAEVRAQAIRKQIAEYEQESGLIADVPDKTFTEVVNLVEYPTVLMGHFEEKFLRVPQEIICDAMLSHQRYFPMHDRNGALVNSFLLVSNGARSRSDVIIDGNERVVRPRLADAEFFYDEDLKTSFDDYVPKLASVVFQEKLGTLLDKTERIEALTANLCDQIDTDEQTRTDALRAAHLCKADLISNVVVEFTSLQGVIGGYYARANGDDDAVALAIADQYRPRFSGDALPGNLPGLIVASADKLDTTVGIFAAGQAPTGASDPFAVRRAAIGIINMLLAGTGFSLEAAIDHAIEGFVGTLEFDASATSADVRAFFATRLEVMARDKGYEADTVAAVRATDIIDPIEFLSRCESLTVARRDDPETFEDLATAYRRANNLTDTTLGTDVEEGLLTDADRALKTAVDETSVQVREALDADDHAKALAALASLRAPIDTFFEDVLIMDEDQSIRENRLRLLNSFVAVFLDIADIGKLGVR